MRPRICAVAVFAAACILAAPAAHAFSVPEKNTDPFALPKFDLEEQAKNFRTGGTDKLPTGKHEFDTFLGKGSFEFGLQQGPSYFGSPLGPNFSPGSGLLGPAPRNTREDFNRVITPENLR